MHSSNDLHYMSLALQLAERGRLTVSPNPMVGCVIVKNNEVVGQGYHQRAGGPHAEIVALQDALEKARDATAYVTLEPCCHYGRTPPCTNALIAAGIKKVYVACIDPNPRMAGKGIEQLRHAGIPVEIGLYEKEARALNAIFFHYIRHKQPFVIAKWAMSLDGKTAANENDAKQISGIAAKQHTHHLRQQVDAILIGANTALQDNPELTARAIAAEDTVQRQPLRIILSGQTTLPAELKLVSGQLPGKTLIAATQRTLPSVEHLASSHVDILLLPENSAGKISLPALLAKLVELDITSLLVEGGMTVHQDFFAEKLVNQIDVYVAPTFIGSLATKQSLTIQHCHQREDDFHFTAHCSGAENV